MQRLFAHDYKKGCSLMTTKIAQNTQLSPSAAAAGLSWLTRAGAQVINISFGGQSGAPYADLCTSQPYDPYCVAIRQAVDYRVTVVAAAGNNKAQYMNFPALDSRVLSVGGLQKNGGGGYEAWNQSVAFNYPPTSPSRSTSSVDETGTDGGTTAQIFAPARDIVSAMYAGYDWSPDYRCGTSRSISPLTPNLYSPPLAGNQTDGFIGSGSGSFGNRYGICTGTSMAAPHVTGVVALIRSANPLLSTASVKSSLQQTAATTALGLPYTNALAAVQSALNTNGRLTPLFIFFSADYADYFQMIVPQMGASALMQGVLPATLSGARVTYGTFSSIGNPVTGFTSFLDGTIPVPKGYSVDNLVPRARVRVFTKPRDAQGTTLTPLFRASFVNNAPGETTFLLRHYIAAGQAERDDLSTSIWKIDGIEG